MNIMKVVDHVLPIQLIMKMKIMTKLGRLIIKLYQWLENSMLHPGFLMTVLHLTFMVILLDFEIGAPFL